MKQQQNKPTLRLAVSRDAAVQQHAGNRRICQPSTATSSSDERTSTPEQRRKRLTDACEEAADNLAAARKPAAKVDDDGPCDACGRAGIKPLNKAPNKFSGTALPHSSFLRTNPETGKAFTVCLYCWDRVKDVRGGCRVWIHNALEAADPGIVKRYQRRFKLYGIFNQDYRDFEALFNAQLDKCLSPSAINRQQPKIAQTWKPRASLRLPAS